MVINLAYSYCVTVFSSRFVVIACFSLYAVVKKRKVGLESDATASPAATPEKVPRPQTEVR